MADPFLGEIMMAGYGFAPRNYAFADGSVLRIQQNTALYTLIGTFFGGDGTTTFGLPNLASQAVCGTGPGPGRPNLYLGYTGGEMAVTLIDATMPPHTHVAESTVGRGVVESPTPTATSSIGQATANIFASSSGQAQMSSPALTTAGGGQPHDNVQPYLGITFCIAMSGAFPTFPH